MNAHDALYQAYLAILREELVPAMGCTEPISLAYAAAKAREVLGCLPQRVRVEVSENILKNVKSVVVPNTGGLHGIEAAVAAGLVAGEASRVLEAISVVPPAQQNAIRDYLAATEISVQTSPSGLTFDLCVEAMAGNDTVKVRISYFHSNIVSIEKNGEALFVNQDCHDGEGSSLDRSLLNVRSILEFAEAVEVEEVRELLERQIAYNSAIADEGLAGTWGATIGKVLLDAWGSDIRVRARARAAAGSDARMSGCSLPVIIVSGSGNQGITASVPVIEYARELKVDRDTLLRALVVSNLVTIHQKTGIGRLSAYCGVVSAGCGAGAGISWLHGGRYEEVAHTIVNALAIVSGIVCDGAKPSCAAKIASAVDAGLLGFEMYQRGKQFYSGDGIVSKGVEPTIANVGRLGRVGMSGTDKEIIRIMLGE